jgi:hypothetical protein
VSLITSTFSTPAPGLSVMRSRPFFSRAIVSRPCGSNAIETHESSSGNAERSSSILNPAGTVIAAASVALPGVSASFQVL